MQKFGDAFLASMLGDNIHEFISLMDGNGDVSDALRERARDSSFTSSPRTLCSRPMS